MSAESSSSWSVYLDSLDVDEEIEVVRRPKIKKMNNEPELLYDCMKDPRLCIFKNATVFIQSYINKLKSCIGDCWFITITLKPKIYKIESKFQYMHTSLEVENICYRHGCMLICPELTKDGNVHYHGIMNFKSNVSRINFCNTLKKSRIIGYFKINSSPIEMWERTMNYIVKEYLLTVTQLGKQMILFDDEDLKNRFNRA